MCDGDSSLDGSLSFCFLRGGEPVSEERAVTAGGGSSMEDFRCCFVADFVLVALSLPALAVGPLESFSGTIETCNKGKTAHLADEETRTLGKCISVMLCIKVN